MSYLFDSANKIVSLHKNLLQELQHDIRQSCKPPKNVVGRGNIVSDEVLLRAYLDKIRQLSAMYSRQCRPTAAERKVARQIVDNTRMTFMKSVWIGPFNFDIFFPQLGTVAGAQGHMKGFVIEVDGGIHNDPLKMSRDQIKYQFLHSMNIGLISVSNSDINSRSFNNIVSNLSKMPRLDSRARKRVLRRIYLMTVLPDLETKYPVRLLNSPTGQNTRPI